MAELYRPELEDLVSPWLMQRKRRYEDTWDKMMSDLRTSGLLYVGNLSFQTTETQIYAFFARMGRIKRVIMGLHRTEKTPCGFCFVEYETHEEAVHAVYVLNGCKLDGRLIRIDLDPGFEEGRQYGRGVSGGQRRDEFRDDFDYGRGGWGAAAKPDVEMDTPSIPSIPAIPTVPSIPSAPTDTIPAFPHHSPVEMVE